MLEHASDGKRDLDSTPPGLFLINIHVTHERHGAQFQEVLGAVPSGMHALRELHEATRLFQARSAAERRLGNLKAVLAEGPHLMREGLADVWRGAGVGPPTRKRSPQMRSLLPSLRRR